MCCDPVFPGLLQFVAHNDPSPTSLCFFHTPFRPWALQSSSLHRTLTVPVTKFPTSQISNSTL